MADHEAVPVEGSAYSMAGRNTGLPADPRDPGHYPVEALCRCGQVISLTSPSQMEWSHTGRMAGDTL